MSDLVKISLTEKKNEMKQYLKKLGLLRRSL